MDIYGVGPAGAARVPGRRRRRDPLRRPQPVRVLDRDRTPRRVVRGAEPPPPVAGREPADEPPAARLGDRADPPATPKAVPTTDRKLAAGKTPMEALRGLKRRCPTSSTANSSTDAGRSQQPDEASPGGHCGATLQSSAADSHPLDRHFGSATSRTRRSRRCADHHSVGRPSLQALLDTEGCQIRSSGRRSPPHGAGRSA